MKPTPTRQQFELKYFIGWSEGATDNARDFSREVIREACALCGGCYVANGTGYWIDGATHSERFSGEPAAENCLQLNISTEPKKLDDVARTMQAHITRLVAQYSMPIQWVHVQQVEIVGRHFDATEAV